MRKQRTAPHVFETRKQIGKWWLTQWIQESRILSCQCFKAKRQPDLYWGTLKKLKNWYTSSTSVHLYFWRWVTGRWGQLKPVRQGKIYRGAVKSPETLTLRSHFSHQKSRLFSEEVKQRVSGLRYSRNGWGHEYYSNKRIKWACTFWMPRLLTSPHQAASSL